MITVIKPDFVFEDERGSLVQLVHEGYKQINVVTSKAGVKRGRHYHKLNREGFYVVSLFPPSFASTVKEPSTT